MAGPKPRKPKFVSRIGTAVVAGPGGKARPATMKNTGAMMPKRGSRKVGPGKYAQ